MTGRDPVAESTVIREVALKVLLEAVTTDQAADAVIERLAPPE